MKSKLWFSSLWVFLLGFILMMMGLDVLYFIGIAVFFIFTLWSTPQAAPYITKEAHEQEKKKTKWTMALAFAYISAGFLALILQTFVL
ncbi:hypothetical protein [Alkalibacterium olivapovliticus]|uniref:Uncharacterized protein n=1 Tax=Alkalibacterium olivapovliticus TaxID=99907 RepID=A0A2T0W679_9LACT|nr:hypothetical protein [Alkalibacterium olivapovliticus]PRY82199.1 hypothetical protein CLV38_11552 [Alkalibacterium olivapovliticus]